MRRAMLFGVVFVLLAGCGPSGKDLVDQHRGELQARIAAIEEFAKKVEAGQASRTDLVLPEGIKLKFKADGEAGNAMELHLAEALGNKPEMDYVHGGIDLMFAREFLNGQRLDNGDSVKRDIENFLKPRYICIVRDATLKLPAASAFGDTFEPGYVEFEVYCYDLTDKKELGMVSGRAESSKEVLARTDHTVNSDQDLKYSLSLNAGVAYGMAMRAHRE